VDVSSRTLAVRIGRDGAESVFPNTAEGIALLIAFCHAHGAELVAMEATGGYEQRPFALLTEAALPVAILNPRQVRRFAEGMGVIEKTDALDAGLIAWFAAVKQARPSPPPAPDQQHRRALVTRLRQLTRVRTAQSNQRRLILDPMVLASIDELLALLQRQIQAIEQEIAALIALDPLWRQLDREFRSLKGVAARTVARLMAEMPEIGTLSNKAISKLAGLAPLARDSGQHQGKRQTRGGRAPVREILFVVASVAGRFEPDFIAFRQRLSDAGKPPKVVRIALAHKLLVRLNAKAREVRQRMAAPPAATDSHAAPQPA
jgi:transposase